MIDALFKSLKTVFNFFSDSNNKTSYFPEKNTSICTDFKIGKFYNLQCYQWNFITVGSGVVFREFCNILLMEKAILHIGNNVFFNNYCSINCLNSLEIGEGSLFGEGVKIYDHNHKHQVINGNLQVERNAFSTQPVKIGKNCWIGSNVTILKGVEIGDNVIIGAGCLIYKSISANSIVKLNQSLSIDTR